MSEAADEKAGVGAGGLGLSGEDHDVYVAQLQEVFESCDSGGRGRLTRPELVVLCSKLQLEEQAEALVTKLLGDQPDGSVTFDQFKEGFVAVLSQSVEGLDATSEEEEPSTAQEDSEDDVSPKYIKGDKKYGRRSRPDGTPPDGTARSRRHPAGQDGTPIDPKELKIPVEDISETFEAEGQLNQSIADMENALDPVSEEEHLHAIWRDLGVGKDGYLTLNELATVCDHIGMDEMNAEELQHLFDKLDTDSDGRVSFDEFLHGLFQHGGPVTTPTVTPVRPSSTPRQKLRMSVVATPFEDRPQTPSFIATVSGLFSTIDPEASGYASADAIVELWEKLGVTHGHEILEYLQFDTHTKVALANLSSALEQEMRTVEEDNATYQAAVVSYQHELKFLKTMSDTACAERDKLRQDLTEANQRIALLIKEGDERQAVSDEKREKELLTLESRYQEQIRALQAEIDGEHEALSLQSARQRSRLENEVARLKEDEVRLRERLTQTQRELERLEHELLEMAEKCADLEKSNGRQQRELEEAAALKLRLEELESAQAQIADEQSKWQSERVQRLETEHTELQDKNDELTVEVEELRQQLASTRRLSRPGGAPGAGDGAGVGRTGSILSDYQRPTLVRRGSETLSSEEEEGGLTGGGGRQRRRLPQPPSSEDAEKDALRAEVDMLRREGEQLKKEREQLRGSLEEVETQKAGLEATNLRLSQEVEELGVARRLALDDNDQLREDLEHVEQLKKRAVEDIKQLRQDLEEADLGREQAEEQVEQLRGKVQQQREQEDDEYEERLARLNRNFSIERKEIEQSYKLEITDIEEEHQRDRQKLLEHFEKEKVALREELEADMELRLVAQEEQLRQTLEEEKRDLLIRLESEKNLLRQQLNEERASLRQNLEMELVAESTAKLREMAERHEQEFATVNSQWEQRQDTTAQLEARVAELELRLKLQHEELQLAFDQERQDLMAAAEEERSRLHASYRQQIAEIENSLAAGEGALKGKLKEDFERLLQQHRAKESLQVKAELLNEQLDQTQQLDREKGELIKDKERELESQAISHRTALAILEAEHKAALATAEQKQRKALSELSTEHEKEIAKVHRVEEKNRQELDDKHQREQRALEDQLARTCEELISAQTLLESERRERKKLEKNLQEAEEQHKRHIDVLEGERDDAAQDSETARRCHEASTANLEERLQAEIQARLEEDFLVQIDRLREAFTAERTELEHRVKLLQAELEDQQARRTEEQNSDLQVEKLNRLNNELTMQKADAEHRIETTTQHYRQLLADKDINQRHLEERLAQLTEAKMDETSASLRASQRNPNLSQSAILEALARQHELLETARGELRSEIRGLRKPSPTSEPITKVHVPVQQSMRPAREQEDLVRELEETTARVIELETALSLAQSEHQRELRTLRESFEGMVDRTELTGLQEALAASQQKVRQLEEMWEQRASETSRMIKGSSESHQAALRKVEAERDELVRQLKTKQELLDAQVTKLREQLEKSTKRDLLIKDLYVENAELLKSLYETERREKEVNSRAAHLHDRCAMLQVLVRKVANAALA